MIEGEPIYDKDVAMQTDHFTVTPGMMAYFFYDYGGEVLVAMEQTKPFDASRSLHDQIYEGDLSFYDVIMNATLKKVSELLIYCEAAHKAGVSLTEAQKKAIDQEMQTLTMTAAIDSQTADVYLQARYGPLMSKEAFRGVLELELLASTYSVTVNRQLESSITGIRVTKAYTNSKLEEEKFARGNEQFVDASRRAYKAMALFHSSTSFVTDIFNVFIHV